MRAILGAERAIPYIISRRLVLDAILLFAWPRSSEPSNAAPRRVWTGFWWMGILAGGLDTIGNVGYTVAVHTGRLGLAALVSSFYLGVTILLAASVLRERPTRRQTLRMAVALAWVVLLSL
jgi:drug/metabolite transporter (DMT)-like permease